MIVDKFENFEKYIAINDKFLEVFNWVKNTDLSKVALGKHEIKSDDIFYISSEYETFEAKDIPWESHKKYIDIQYVVSGTEEIGYSNIEMFNVSKEYNSESDVMLGNAEGDFICMNKDYFMILFPDDVHKPSTTHNNIKSNIKKVVIKVKL